MNNDAILELLNALFVAGIIGFLLVIRRRHRVFNKPGSNLVLAGFCTVLIGCLLDISDEFPSLNHLVVVGETPVEAFLEKFFGFLLGNGLILAGFIRTMPLYGKLEEKNRQIETIIATIPAPTYFMDTDGLYQECNRAFENIIGRNREQILGHPLADLIGPEAAAPYQQYDRELLAQGGKQVFETRCCQPADAPRDMLFHKAVLPREDGSAGGIVGILLDITDRKQAEETLRRFDRIKSEFISTAAHELSTPLTTIQGYTELLLDEQGGFTRQQQGEFVAEIGEGTQRLATIIDDLLDISRIETGRPLPMTFAEVDPHTLLQKSIEHFRFNREQLQLDLDDRLPAELRLYCDGFRLEQVLLNLLSNAAKYSPKGGTVRIAAELQAGELLIQVEDDGIGMTPEQIAQVFNKFYRADTSDTAIPGLGLGMTIVKTIIEAHRGRIRVESEPGRGTQVAVYLPLAPEAARPGPDEPFA